MPDEAKRGDHDLTDFERPPLGDAQGEFVIEVERDAIEERRQYLKGNGIRDRTDCPLTGLALSGGGIRSASFGLGALQALHAYAGIEGIDYLSTVSGGGYIGCSLTAAMQKNGGEFPFTNPENYGDTDAVRHIRDYSNYLAPFGALDFVPALGIILRGLVANMVIILPILLFFVGITLVTYPTVESLSEPRLLVWTLPDVADALGLLPASFPLWRLHGYWFTVSLAVAAIFSLIVWAIVVSLQSWDARNMTAIEMGEAFFSTFWNGFFFLTLISLWFETQPFILRAITAPEYGAVLYDWLAQAMPWLVALGLFSAYLPFHNWKSLVMKTLAKTALWFTAIIVPSFLWLLYLWLTSILIGSETSRSAYIFVFFVFPLLMLQFIDPNATSLHRLYRNRLSRAFLFDPDRRHLDRYGSHSKFEPRLHEIDTDLCPYPIINTALNIQGSRLANLRRRNAGLFILTPEYTGSDLTRYIGTQRIETEEPLLDLGTAMAISGAAVSPNMGAATIRALRFTSALLNIRLGYWLRNPRAVGRGPLWLKRLIDMRGFLLIKEMFGRIKQTSRMVYLTDGGHLENLGVYSLLKRRCKLIIAIDAEADPEMRFTSLRTLERYAQIDLGAIVRLPWLAIRDQTLNFEKAIDDADMSGAASPASSGPHCAAGVILYGPDEPPGTLLYVKASLSGDESSTILDYKRRHRAFPHEATSDQFFDEEKLEAYRALGFHIMKGLLREGAPIAVLPNPIESADKAWARILAEIRAALLGVPLAPRAADG